jgi:hypothetical protein
MRLADSPRPDEEQVMLEPLADVSAQHVQGVLEDRRTSYRDVASMFRAGYPGSIRAHM